MQVPRRNLQLVLEIAGENEVQPTKPISSHLDSRDLTVLHRLDMDLMRVVYFWI